MVINSVEKLKRFFLELSTFRERKIQTKVKVALLERAGVGSIPANSDAHNVPSFCRLRFEMMLSHFIYCDL
jgi:hypothetical protein